MLAKNAGPKLKVKVISTYDDYVPEFYTNFQIPSSHIDESLEREVQHWTPENPVLIDAPTGTGKTTFVYKHLIPTAMAAGKGVLLVSNRIALSSQQKLNLLKILESPLLKLLTPEGIQEREDFGRVWVITYHRLPALLNDPAIKPWLENLAFVIFDESHFFTADALFNDKCDLYLKLATKRFCHTIRVYMTATSWDVLVPLAEAERENYQSHLMGPPIFYRTFYRYWLPEQDRHNRLHFFSKMDDLIPQMRANPQEKWLVFIDKKLLGQQFEKKLADCVTYLDADSKGTTTWDEIVQTEQFSRQILITTSVLDCGINIRDPQLKHIVVTTDNRTSLVQMLGRKRFEPGETVAVWICDLDRRVISARVNRLQTYRSWFKRLEGCGSPEARMKVARAIWQSDDPALLKLFRLGDKDLFPNDLAYWVIQRRLYALQKILNGQTTFREQVASWLGVELPSLQDQSAPLKDFYDTWGEKPLSAEQQDELRRLICELYIATEHKNAQPTRVLGYLALSNRLKEMELPYRVTADGDVWTLRCVAKV